MGQVFAITGSGLKPIGNEPIKIHAGGKYHYGHSNSPDPIWVESVNDDWVTFYRYPYGDAQRQREQENIFRYTAQEGTATELKKLKRMFDQWRDDRPGWLVLLICHYEAVLAGKVGQTWERDDIRMVKVEFSYNGEGDGWSEFEKYYPHSVSSATIPEDGKPTVYVSYDFSKAQAAELCHDMNCGKLPGFSWVGSSFRDS